MTESYGNVAQLLLARSLDTPTARLGVPEDPMTVADATARAASLAGQLLDDGLVAGDPVALIGSNSHAWLTTWMACQLAGLPVALVNPSFPDDLIHQVLSPLAPQAVLSTDQRPRPALPWPCTDLADDHAAPRSVDTRGWPGLAADSGSPSAYMLTSGTSGPPKLVVQSHRYFLSLGRYVADVLGLTDADTVLTPLPLFHINPLGYAVLGALTARASCLTSTAFSASGFWPTVRDSGTTAAILHAPPLEILKRRTTRDDARGHRLRVVFYADPEFLREFQVPLGVSVYGSTELGGLCHTHLWRPDDTDTPTEGAVHYGGQVRPGLEHRINGSGEIEVRAHRDGVLASGYLRPDRIIEPLTRDGWFASGDLGREDPDGGLIYLARASESVRIKGEYVPLAFVDNAFRAVDGIDDAAVWKRPSSLVDDELVLFVESDRLNVEDIRARSATLPAFMRPAAIARMQQLPRDTTVAKVRRRQLQLIDALEVVEL